MDCRKSESPPTVAARCELPRAGRVPVAALGLTPWPRGRVEALAGWLLLLHHLSVALPKDAALPHQDVERFVRQ